MGNIFSFSTTPSDLLSLIQGCGSSALDVYLTFTNKVALLATPQPRPPSIGRLLNNESIAVSSVGKELTPGDARYTTIHDGVSHHPLGAGSYIFKTDYAKALLTYLNLYPKTEDATDQRPFNRPRPRKLIVHIGAQPNNSPHAGTMITFALGFIIARKIQRRYCDMGGDTGKLPPLTVSVSLDLVDTAPDSKKTIEKDGIAYQRSHRNTNAMAEFLPDYSELLERLSTFTNNEVQYTCTRQADLLKSKHIPKVLDVILADHVRIGRELGPESNRIALRAACPVEGCGIAEKHGKLNQYHYGDGIPTVTFNCLHHGPHTSSLVPAHIEKFELNTPLRNLVRGVANMLDTIETQGDVDGEERYHLRVTGGDYAGIYQEQLFYRQINCLMKAVFPQCSQLPLPVICYAPLLTDWSGAKLSKSLYVKEGAYAYLEEQNKDYLLSYSRMKEMGKDPRVIFREVESWVEDPRRLFRNYSVEYFTRLFEQADEPDVHPVAAPVALPLPYSPRNIVNSRQ
ncbi:hypothetical protein PC9H_003098 [Pleurotus ostreatus]|uniref:Uncharacterized protein n=2 Tax=Pleurotus ostreatus TaxID=5322 RepID=A0A067NTG3_PLEO1|nr:uncharacterized protein PC9H_003098 [Pleurotus ostreatus]KAF7436269.1 hypothetical protein PC9H_003098 [Pleurotus ostreatus]KDQ31348.1 hypothetical protein PLEOSDRAFT_1102323 [Pleurotus ostreatus PC15]